MPEEYRTIEELEVAFQAILATMPDDQREAIMHHIDTMEVTNEQLDEFNRQHPGFSEQVMALYRQRMAK